MPRRKKNPTLESSERQGPSPEEVAGETEDNTPLVSSPPPETVKGEEGDGSIKKKRRKRRTTKPNQEELDRLAANKMIATTMVESQIGLSVRFGGELWKAEQSERDAMIAAWARYLGRYEELPWWMELVLAEAAYVGPRIAMMHLEAQQKSTAKEDTVDLNGGGGFGEPAKLATTGDSLAPVAKKDG